LDENTLVKVCGNYEKFRIDMVKTYGLTHVAVAVRDLDRTEAFYGGILGAKVVYRDAAFLQMQTPGARDVLVFEKDAKKAGKAGGVLHFGFRLMKEKDIAVAREAVKKAGGKITDTGEFIPGEPYLFTTDPDGYTIEIWYEIPTPVDPR
jgi:catechol 2,3-dioxygenase-like lactoylglutathione lyase family enzyme